MSAVPLVEDDGRIGALLADQLRLQGLEVGWSRTLEQGRRGLDAVVVVLTAHGDEVDVLAQVAAANPRTAPAAQTARASRAEDSRPSAHGAAAVTTSSTARRQAWREPRVNQRADASSAA